MSSLDSEGTMPGGRGVTGFKSILFSIDSRQSLSLSGGGAELHFKMRPRRCGSLGTLPRRVQKLYTGIHEFRFCIASTMAATNGPVNGVASFPVKRHNEGPKMKKKLTMYDNVPADVTNLQMGAPGDTQLKKAAEILKEAAVHRMVCFS